MTSLTLSDEVSAALAAGKPVVALESTIISHGLPRPRNHAAALEFESILRDAGVTPATIA
ncbi:MAG: pseudouridine-5'-phosphate glycosidase, partial [Microcella sp.]|nr:pseudouridine-5'-phosphate glycosidase [Microcella sp.]